MGKFGHSLLRLHFGIAPPRRLDYEAHKADLFPDNKPWRQANSLLYLTGK